MFKIKPLVSERPGFKFRFLWLMAEKHGHIATSLSLSFLIGKPVIIIVSVS